MGGALAPPQGPRGRVVCWGRRSGLARSKSRGHRVRACSSRSRGTGHGGGGGRPRVGLGWAESVIYYSSYFTEITNIPCGKFK